MKNNDSTKNASPSATNNLAAKTNLKSKPEIKLLIFDMGKVFVRFDWGRTYDAFVELTKKDLEAVKNAFTAVYFPFERGHITTQDVIDHLNKELEATLDHGQFSRAWTSTLDEDKEMTALLQTLRQTKLPMYLLSNINEVSFGYLQDNFNVSRHFDELVLSYEVGHIKPALEIYHEVLKRSGTPAENCLFIDDMEENIHAAQSVGINCVHFNGIEHLRQELLRLDILKE